MISIEYHWFWLIFKIIVFSKTSPAKSAEMIAIILGALETAILSFPTHLKSSKSTYKSPRYRAECAVTPSRTDIVSSLTRLDPRGMSPPGRALPNREASKICEEQLHLNAALGATIACGYFSFKNRKSDEKSGSPKSPPQMG